MMKNSELTESDSSTPVYVYTLALFGESHFFTTCSIAVWAASRHLSTVFAARKRVIHLHAIVRKFSILSLLSAAFV